MKKCTYYLILCATIARSLLAHAPLTLASSAGDGEIDSLVHDIAALQEQAYDIRDGLKLVPEHTARYQKHIQRLIEELTEKKVQEAQLEPIKNALSRYQVLADACARAGKRPQELQHVLSLFEQRAALVNKIALPAYACHQAQTLLYSLKNHIGRALTPAERHALAAQRAALVTEKNELAAGAHLELFEIEKELYRDRRPWFKRNGKALLGVLATLGIGVGSLIALNKLHEWYGARTANR